MKRELTWVAMTTFLMAATSCSQTEIDEQGGGIPPVSKPVTLGVNVGVNKTKAAITGTAITYSSTPADYVKTAFGIGLVVTNADVSDYYKSTTANFDIGYKPYPTVGSDICFMGDAAGANWKAIEVTPFPTAATAEKAKPFYLDKNPGKIFAYYPYDKVASGRKMAKIADGAVTFPVDVPATTTTKIDGTLANSAKVFGASWADNKSKNPVNVSADEVDYLYFRPEVGWGRFVNNGANPGTDGLVTPPDATGQNMSETNPGNSISLTMKHALSMITFRLYDKDLVAKIPTGTPGVTTLGSVTSFKITNVTASSGAFKVGTGEMIISNNDAATSAIKNDAATGEELTRDIDNAKPYLLVRARATGTKDIAGTTETASKFTYLYATGEDGRAAANYISTLVYPKTDLTENSVKVIFQIKEPGTSAQPFPLEAILPVPTDAEGNAGWQPNKNYIYTFSVSKKGLNVVDVKVADWESVEIDKVIDL